MQRFCCNYVYPSLVWSSILIASDVVHWSCQVGVLDLSRYLKDGNYLGKPSVDEEE